MKHISCIFNSISNVEKIITIFNNTNYNLKNISFISFISFNDFSSIKNRLQLDFKINTLISDKKIKDLIMAKLFLITENNYLILTGPASNYFDNKNIREINDILLTSGILEEYIETYLSYLYGSNVLFIFPINEKNEDEVFTLLKNNNAQFLEIN